MERMTILRRSNNIDEVAWYDDNSNGETHPVGQKKENGYGLYDMSGNVSEWVWDSWLREYEFWLRQREYDFTTTDPVYVDMSCDERVYRGGGWCNGAGDTRVSFRIMASCRSNDLGFRFLRTN